MRKSGDLASTLARLNATVEAESRGTAAMYGQLRIQTVLLAALTWQRTGVRSAGFDDLALPDPFAPLVPYARAMVAIQQVASRACVGVDPSRSTPDALTPPSAATPRPDGGGA